MQKVAIIFRVLISAIEYAKEKKNEINLNTNVENEK